MKKLVLLIVFILSSTLLFSQFDIEAYKEFIEKNKDMSVEQLLQMYPAGNFLEDAPTDFYGSEFGNEIADKFSLTPYEVSLINKHGFMVSERLNYPTFIHSFWDIFIKDMPVYISSDAVLQALHFSFNKILINFEDYHIVKNLDSALRKIKDEMYLIDTNNKPEIYMKAVNDADIYITVAARLLNIKSSCMNPVNDEKVTNLMKLIDDKQPAYVKLFSDSTLRFIDFSQFTPRGHYTINIKLTKYFLAMMWLGRTEICITNPENEGSFLYSDEDLQRMAVLSALIAELSVKSKAYTNFETIESIMKALLGTQDNISLFEVVSVLDSLDFDALDICDDTKWKMYQEKLLELSSSSQLYNSQILYSDAFSPEQIVPPSVFLLMGQRPILDGFITANVVYDRVMFKKSKIMRMVPSTLDILFAFGNDATVQLLDDELTKYPYSSNLASLRYLINSYDDDFWKTSSYTLWLNGIRSLNPPLDRSKLPKFMQTAAWWQKTMNTQLASWSQLRYNFVLYAKQPYTDSWMCSYPYGFIEPNVEFYQRIKNFFISLNELSISLNKSIKGDSFFERWISVCDNLSSLSEKILNDEEFDDEDNDFICSTIKKGKICDPSPEANDLGWYANLYFPNDPSTLSNYYLSKDSEGLESDKMIITDVHTIPMDEVGMEVGWVLHAGTGRVNNAVITAPTPDGSTRSYIGPVFSYYEFLSNDFKRLTNEEWREMDGKPAFRPEFTNLYLADKDGNSPNGEKVSLYSVPSSVEKEKPSENLRNLDCFPNPFSGNTSIQFTLTSRDLDNIIELSIFDLKGNLVKTLMNEYPQGKNYSIVWDGTDSKNIKLPSGTYIYTLKSGTNVQSGKVSITR
ncbi:MAG: DUF3160 domain-containing protein [Candidatus Kapaibacterium sp.]